MEICVTATTNNLDGKIDERFGRCKFFIFVDPETMSFRAVSNPAVGESGGAGIKAATMVLKQAPSAIVTGMIGGNALEVLQAANAGIYTCKNVSVREAVGMYIAGRLNKIEAPNNT